MTRTRLAILSWLGALAWAAAGHASAGPLPSPRLQAAAAEAVRLAGGEARILKAEGRSLAGGGYVVCGTLAAAGESLPFAALWRPGEPADRGATLVGANREARARSRRGWAFHRSIALTCAKAGLQSALPPAG